jgi:hypothetical protein
VRPAGGALLDHREQLVHPIAIAPMTTRPANARPIRIDEPADISR